MIRICVRLSIDEEEQTFKETDYDMELDDIADLIR